MEQSSKERSTRYDALLTEIQLLDKKIKEFEAKGITTDVQSEIKALHDYNEMKDLTQIVLGYLANAEHVPVSELYIRYNLPLD